MISIRNVSKKYDRYNNPADRFKEFFFDTPKDRFWALNDISLDIEKGQTVAIIGPNGSGKSTLLQIIAGILHPSSGEVSVEGKVSALLELGAGFNPDFTGKENVYLNASILGMSQKEIDSKYSDIVAFSGIGDFINKPVKTYSSGMFVRLAFATAINVDPDVLIVDEALAVGDVAFQQRCMSKIKQMQAQGKTIIFVSHDTSAVKSLCDHAILMHHGKILDQGSPDLMVNQYLKLVYNDTLANVSESDQEGVLKTLATSHFEMVKTIPNIDNRFGNEDAQIIGIALLDEKGEETAGLQSGTSINVKVSVEYLQKVEHPIIGIVLRDRLGNDLTATNTYLEGLALEAGDPGDIHTVLFTINAPELLKGHYSISPAVANGTLVDHEMCDWIDNAITFEIINSRTVFGMMRFSTDIAYSTQKE